MRLGDRRFLHGQAIDTSPLTATADAVRVDGATAVFIAIDGKAAGVLAIADPIKPTTLEAVRALRAEGVRVVMLTSYSEREKITQALAAGAVSYLTKDAPPEAVIRAIRSAAQSTAP